MVFIYLQESAEQSKKSSAYGRSNNLTPLNNPLLQLYDMYAIMFLSHYFLGRFFLFHIENKYV